MNASNTTTSPADTPKFPHPDAAEKGTTTSPNVLIVRGHPRRSSLSDALADAYTSGARESGARVRCITPAEMDFELDVLAQEPVEQSLEEDLIRSQKLIEWADHLVFVYPTWWGTTPARLKGFLDRILTSKFAFEFEKPNDVRNWKQLLSGRSAHIITTMDTPSWVYRWIYGSPGHNAMKRATLGFCGIKPVRTTSFGPVKESTLAERNEWLKQVYEAGRRLESGRLTLREQLQEHLMRWLKAIRPQFYPMTWLGYTVGALGAGLDHELFLTPVYWLGYLFLFLVEAATVFTNDYFDYESDRINVEYGPFTGGSRMLVDGSLSFQEMRLGISAALGFSIATGIGLLFLTPTPIGAGVLMCAALVLGLGYTAPPLKLSHRGLGELTVGITHSFLVILCGYVFQGGRWTHPFPWLASLPLFLGVLPAIILSGIPDYTADRSAGKETVVVKFGPERSVVLAGLSTLLASAAAFLVSAANPLPDIYSGASYTIAPHAAFLIYLLYRYRRKGLEPGRIDYLMVVSLSFIIWFGALPLYHLLSY